jgi:hypothetical protein
MRAVDQQQLVMAQCALHICFAAQLLKQASRMVSMLLLMCVHCMRACSCLAGPQKMLLTPHCACISGAGRSKPG